MPRDRWDYLKRRARADENRMRNPRRDGELQECGGDRSESVLEIRFDARPLDTYCVKESCDPQLSGGRWSLVIRRWSWSSVVSHLVVRHSSARVARSTRPTTIRRTTNDQG